MSNWFFLRSLANILMLLQSLLISFNAKNELVCFHSNWMVYRSVNRRSVDWCLTGMDIFDKNCQKNRTHFLIIWMKIPKLNKEKSVYNNSYSPMMRNSIQWTMSAPRRPFCICAFQRDNESVLKQILCSLIQKQVYTCDYAIA